ncbi:Oxidoreductase [[Actinomadura] parvosata subsp. kistnae]|uniref:NmrA family transcriptional regulator n=1 Tax=[Actinomadura] parvosata subsp. kistnae TaxID=1909395 RepID=A0A1V0A0W6_9ACTN|nr:NAD(P)H-binding protein [Nonomuraea sp. ATCC 55076]AQZ63854.1 NmrA family transcriptional regulator [Nonomuraea sp. ATCC 55076]SPL89687.1 Oxidoreductase [Actinomadura parvosata subsp. kistnae]
MFVITGATGNVGGELVRLLAAAGEQVTAISRRPAPLPGGVRHSAGDLGDPASLKDAFDGAGALFLLVAGHEPHAVLEAARAGGIRRVVLLSSQGAGTRPGLYGHPAAFEQAVRESGLEWTILRPGGFASNALAWAEPIRAHRTAAAPFADVALPVIDPADIAEVASVVLREDGHAGRTYVLTGPQPVSPRERAAAIGEALGTEVRFVEQSREEARAQMLTFMPEQAVEGTLTILGTPTEEERQVSPDVARLLGRAPRTFASWAARNIAAFR